MAQIKDNLVGIDVGGTFTDLICFDSKNFHAAEVCHKERLILISFLHSV